MSASKVIGVTGGIGSGKSFVLSFIQDNYPATVLLADEIGRELMEPGKSVYEALVSHYGNGILKENSEIDREKLGSIGLKDESHQKELNEIEHPLIKEEILRRIELSETPVVFIEAALLIEGGLTHLCSEIWYVYTKESIRIERLMKNRGYSREKCVQIIKRQLSEEVFKEYATVIIANNGSRQELTETIREKMEELKKAYAF